MAVHDTQGTFRGLPLTEEQNAEVMHYINRQKRRGAPVDEHEISAMLADMLNPPSQEDVGAAALGTSTCGDAERASGSVDDVRDLIEAQEDKSAAMESEAMKRAGS
ncbi:hypothetical protein Q4S45_08730 [Massilia sp. R2A-15]|uniref:hypothetical protein n=1 Tax=Massilia sp. R2A-15 TaxID=3064278 RepID=UPI002735E6B4|nr:hypothetical protein [Massilia sp. R2A-15]WLI91185.1 hypothetical protein Q4S45_08730 [Massilia sp. R2A-15]